MPKTIIIHSFDGYGNPITKEIRPGRYLECGCCGAFHHELCDFDCRDSEWRFELEDLLSSDDFSPKRGIEVIYINKAGDDWDFRGRRRSCSSLT